MQNIINTFKQIGLLTVALTLALVGNFAYGQWSNPTQAPTGGNVAVPLNVSSNPQVKNGNLGLDGLDVFGMVTLEETAPRLEFKDSNDGTSNWIYSNDERMLFIHDRNGDGSWSGETPYPFEVNAGARSSDDYARFSNEVRAREYCDQDGRDCFEANEVGAAGSPAGMPSQGFLQCRNFGWRDLELDSDERPDRGLRYMVTPNSVATRCENLGYDFGVSLSNWGRQDGNAGWCGFSNARTAFYQYDTNAGRERWTQTDDRCEEGSVAEAICCRFET